MRRNWRRRKSRSGAEREFVDHYYPALTSGLVFSNANVKTKEGLLTSAQLADLDLRGTRLATVLACEGHLGDIKGGEGMLSVQRGFHLAGVSKTVTAGWPVDAVMSGILIREFNTNVFAKKLRPAEALRAAQLQAINNKKSTQQNPAHWAAWVVSSGPRD